MPSAYLNITGRWFLNRHGDDLWAALKNATLLVKRVKEEFKMRKLAFTLIPIIALLCLSSGCQSQFFRGEKKGYRITLKTMGIGLDQIAHLESVLTDRGYGAPRQRSLPEKNRPDRVIDDMLLRMSSNPHYVVYIAITYDKELASRKALNLTVSINNDIEGAVIPEIKGEIDTVGDLIYEFLSSEAGKENVKQERFLTYPPWG